MLGSFFLGVENALLQPLWLRYCFLKTFPSNRSVYTRQILDILSNISKQRIETSKIIEDVKSAQKDINLLDGKLYRTYIEADNKVFEVCLEMISLGYCNLKVIDHPWLGMG